MKTVKKIIAEVSGVDYENISNSTYIYDDLNLDESDMEDVRSEIEAHYDVEIPDWDYDELILVRDVVTSVRRQL